MSRFDEEALNWDTPAKIDRAENIADAINSKITLSPKMAAFEYGAGTGLLSFALKDKLGPIILADVSEGMLDVLQEKIQNRNIGDMTAVNLDLTVDPLPEERFDIVYTMMTLHHIKDTEQILSKFYKLLNPGGFLCVADLDKEDGSFHGKEVDDVHRGFDRQKLSDLAKSIGFSHINISTAYRLEHEINDAGDTAIFPIFLMTAQKEAEK